MKYKYSNYLEELLTKNEKVAILKHIQVNVKMGYLETNTHFTIRDSNGLENFKRIDVYINELGLILLSSLVHNEK